VNAAPALSAFLAGPELEARPAGLQGWQASAASTERELPKLDVDSIPIIRFRSQSVAALTFGGLPKIW
jgi:hypothetical protein